MASPAAPGPAAGPVYLNRVPRLCQPEIT